MRAASSTTSIATLTCFSSSLDDESESGHRTEGRRSVRANYLVKNGEASEAFEEREVADPSPAAGQMRIAVEAFGLNYADVSARHGLYQDAPPLPSVLGYEVVGRVDALGAGVSGFSEGQRVAALTRFGGYATSAVTDARAAVAIPDDLDVGVAAALPTQGCTAYYMAVDAFNMHAGDHVLIHAAAGGVGTLLVQLCKDRGCVVYGTAGSADKLELLRELGVDHPINYRDSDFVTEIGRLRGSEGLDAIFDSIGGSYVRRGLGLLAAGGKMICFGAASHEAGSLQLLRSVKFLAAWGILHPVPLLMRSRSLIGVNMLRISDDRPEILARCMQGVGDLVLSGRLSPIVGGRFAASEIAAAHSLLESRKSTGKIVVEW
jgi:NADPH2:quinone reductase